MVTMQHYDGHVELSNIKTPALIMCREYDEATPASCKEFTDQIAGAQYAEFRNASHLTFVDRREKYIQVGPPRWGRLGIDVSICSAFGRPPRSVQ